MIRELKPYDIGVSTKPERTSSSTIDEKESRFLDGNWISVKRQLPTKDFLILIYDTELTVSWAVALFDGKNFFSVSGEKVTIFKNVTHWMRLPNSPDDVEVEEHSVAK